MQTQLFLPRNPTSLLIPSLLPVSPILVTKDHLGRTWGRLIQAEAALATPEAILRHGKGWPSRNAWVLVPKSIMIACPAGNHGHEAINTWEGNRSLQPQPQPALCPSVPGGRLVLAPGVSLTQEVDGCPCSQCRPRPLFLSCSSSRKLAKKVAPGRVQGSALGPQVAPPLEPWAPSLRLHASHSLSSILRPLLDQGPRPRDPRI